MSIHFLLFVLQVLGDDEIETTTKSDRFCRERDRPITSDRDDLFNLAEVVIGEKIMLQCHFCKENDDSLAKNWFKLDKLNDSIKYEVQLGMENNMSLNRIHLDLEHTLVIHNITEKDGGEYFCKGLEDEDVAYKFNFFVDVTNDTDITPESGNLSAWKKYHDEQYVPINKLFASASGPEYTFLKEKMNLNVELVTEWDTAGPCEICGRPKGDGRRRKKGHCRFKLFPRSNKTIITQNYQEKMLLRATHLSCRSLTLRKLIPEIMNKTQVIPDFVEIEKCDGTCNPDAEGVYKGWKSTKKTGYKYRKTFVLAEDAHLTIICPESTLENKVVWKINGMRIRPGESVEPPAPNIEPRVTVDSLNTLYLYGVTKEEEGNYTCHVDDVRMQLVRVFVVSKAKLLTQAFFRHMMYLAFVLSLTISCYCGGLIITWSRKSTFKTYDDICEELKRKKKLPHGHDDSYDIEKGKQSPGSKHSDELKKLLSSSTPSVTKTTTSTDYDSPTQNTSVGDETTSKPTTTSNDKYLSETTTSYHTSDSEKNKKKCFFTRKKKTPKSAVSRTPKSGTTKTPISGKNKTPKSEIIKTQISSKKSKLGTKSIDKKLSASKSSTTSSDRKLKRKRSKTPILKKQMGHLKNNRKANLTIENEKAGGVKINDSDDQSELPLLSQTTTSDITSDSDKKKRVSCFAHRSKKYKKSKRDKMKS